MQIIKPRAYIDDEFICGLEDGEKVLRKLERIGRTCYKSEGNIEPGSAPDFLRKRIKQEHEGILEHQSVTVRFIIDRGVSHELVRHRIASFAQESTRYCNYGNDEHGVTFILPFFFDTGMDVNSNSFVFDEWKSTCERTERAYLQLLAYGATPQQARCVLPNSLKTEVVMTANCREWRHFFRLRTAPAAHPQMRQVTIPLLDEFQNTIPVLFEDIVVAG